jgi:RNA polymerase sigma-70 factor (ECF subfamily)
MADEIRLAFTGAGPGRAGAGRVVFGRTALSACDPSIPAEAASVALLSRSPTVPAFAVAQRRAMTAVEDRELGELLLRVARQDRAAFADLYGRTSGTLFAVCRRVLRDRALAEDAAHDAYVRIWRRGHSFDPTRGAAMAWLVTIARRCAVDRLRHGVAVGGEEPETNDIVDEVDELEQVLLRSDIGACLGMVSAEQRRALLVVYFGGLTHEQAAERMGVPLGTLKSRVRRGLQRMKDCLDR